MYEPANEMNLYSAIKDLQDDLMIFNKESEILLFNGIELLVNAKSIPYDLIAIYQFKMGTKRNSK